MVQKTYFKTKDHCKVKFSFMPENAETVEILGLNSDWGKSDGMRKKKDRPVCWEVTLPKNKQPEFQYRINATEWANDPEADSQQVNPFGGVNSVIIL